MKTHVNRRYRVSVRLQIVDRQTDEPLGRPFLYKFYAQISPEKYKDEPEEVKILVRRNFSDQVAHTYAIDKRVRLNQIYGEGKWKVLNLNDLKYVLIEDQDGS